MPYDMKEMLGPPSGAAPSSGSKKAKKTSYLDGKSPELVAHLMSAVDSELSDEERAEALCRAIEASGAEEEESEGELEEVAPPPGTGGDLF
jgi:hypothetical protein